MEWWKQMSNHEPVVWSRSSSWSRMLWNLAPISRQKYLGNYSFLTFVITRGGCIWQISIQFTVAFRDHASSAFSWELSPADIDTDNFLMISKWISHQFQLASALNHGSCWYFRCRKPSHFISYPTPSHFSPKLPSLFRSRSDHVRPHQTFAFIPWCLLNRSLSQDARFPHNRTSRRDNRSFDLSQLRSNLKHQYFSDIIPIAISRHLPQNSANLSTLLRSFQNHLHRPYSPSSLFLIKGLLRLGLAQHEIGLISLQKLLRYLVE